MTDPPRTTKQAASPPLDKENDAGRVSDELKSAIEQVLDYLEPELADYEACVQNGEDAENHIYHAVGVLADWLGEQQQQARDDAGVQEADIAAAQLELDDAHVFAPESIAKTIPPLYATEHESDPVAILKWFSPSTSWTWYVLEYDNSPDKVCFGLVDGFHRELGYFSLVEIESARGPRGLPPERDLHFSPTPLSELYLELDRER